MKQDHLALRRSVKKRKPDFLRQDCHKKPSLGKKWRRPKGITSKIRLSKKGYRKKVREGYRSPKDVRGLSRDGKEMVIVFNRDGVKELNKTTQIMIIGSSVGKRKRLDMVQEALERGISMMNQKNPEEFVKKVKEELAKRKDAKIKSTKKKEEKKKTEKKKEKETEEKKGETEEKSYEDKKKEEKIEKDKLLTKKT